MEKQRPLVLVTNDDGIASPGLKAAVRGVLKYADVIVAAPCRQQTGTYGGGTIGSGCGISRRSAVRCTLQCRKLYNRRNENVGGLLPFIRC